MLDTSAKRLRDGLNDQPETKAALLSTVGAVYDSLGQYQDALPILDESLQLQPGAHDRSRVNTLLELGRARIGAGKLPEAEAPLQEALHLAQNNFGAASLESGHALWELGMLRLQQSQNGEAKDLVIRSLGILETARALQADISLVLDDLATVYTREQQWALAKQTYERSLEIDRRVLGDNHARVTMRLNNLAIVAQNMGDLPKAESLYREAIRRHERTYGERHPETALVKGNLGLLLQREGRLAEAEPLLRGALDAKLAVYGPDNYKVGYTRVSLAMLLHDQGNLADAESEFRQALAIYDKTLPANHLYRASALMYLARLLVDSGKIRRGACLERAIAEDFDVDSTSLECTDGSGPRHSCLCPRPSRPFAAICR